MIDLSKYGISKSDVVSTFINYRIHELKKQLSNRLINIGDVRATTESLILMPGYAQMVCGIEVRGLDQLYELRKKTYKEFYETSEEIDWLYNARSLGVGYQDLVNKYTERGVLTGYAKIKLSSIKALVRRYKKTIAWWEQELKLNAKYGDGPDGYQLLDKSGMESNPDNIRLYIHDINNRIIQLNELKSRLISLQNNALEE